MWMKIRKTASATHRLAWIKADAMQKLREDDRFQNLVDYEVDDDCLMVYDRRSHMTTEELKVLVALVQRNEE